MKANCKAFPSLSDGASMASSRIAVVHRGILGAVLQPTQLGLVQVFQNCDELFSREELSAVPDVGWPDCFNSGVFVYVPSESTYDALIKFASDHGSFDGKYPLPIWNRLVSRQYCLNRGSCFSWLEEPSYLCSMPK